MHTLESTTQSATEESTIYISDDSCEMDGKYINYSNMAIIVKLICDPL